MNPFVPPTLEAVHLRLAFAPGEAVIRDLSLSLSPGELVCLIGRSGCGKSTLIKLLAGFTQPSRGHCLLDGNPCGRPGPDRCVIFQEDSLFPWLTVAENVAFGLTGRLSKRERQRESARFLELVGLAGYGDYLPRQLSGGMKQRVALARVLVLRPKVLLMDEPFGALDAQSREQIQELLLHLWQKEAHTILFVTHDVREAVTLADRVLFMDAGRIRKEYLLRSLPRPRDTASSDFLAACHYIHEQLRTGPVGEQI